MSNFDKFTVLLNEMSDGWQQKDPRIWAQTLQQLVIYYLQGDSMFRISDANGTPLSPYNILRASNSLDKLMLKVGDVVIVKVKNGLINVGAMFAVWLHGCVVCPIDPNSTTEQTSFIADMTKAIAVFESDGRLRHIDRQQQFRLQAKYSTGVDLALIFITKTNSNDYVMAKLTNCNVISSLRSIGPFLNIQKTSRILHTTPMFLEQSICYILLSLFAGCAFVISNGINCNKSILDLMHYANPNILLIEAKLVEILSNELISNGQPICSLNSILNIYGELKPSTINTLYDLLPKTCIYKTYWLPGMTCALLFLYHLVDGVVLSSGISMRGVEARVVIVEPDGTLVEADFYKTGELYLRGSLTYQQDNKHNSRIKFIDGYYRDDIWVATGELFEKNSHGNLYFQGEIQ